MEKTSVRNQQEKVFDNRSRIMYITTIEEVLPSNYPGSAMHPNTPGSPAIISMVGQPHNTVRVDQWL